LSALQHKKANKKEKNEIIRLKVKKISIKKGKFRVNQQIKTSINNGSNNKQQK
jgi:hypothetical protein